jgi:cytosine/adenosine deaminase-related metal-dependent hydrolase
LAKVLGSAALALIAGIGYLWLSLFPPEPALVPPRGGSLANVMLIEPGVGRQSGKTIAFESGVVTTIEDSTSTDNMRYVLPGLIDMHVHQPVSVVGFEEYFSLLYLLHGVTTVRDLGYSYPDVFERRARIVAGEFAGPRTFTCGNMLDGSPPLWEEATVVATAAEAEPVVMKLAVEGADCIKVYTNLQPDVLTAIHQAADTAGLPVIGHIPVNITFEDARLDDVQHLIGVPDQSHSPGDSNPFAEGWDAITDERIAFIAETSLTQNSAHTPTLVFIDYNARLDRPDELRSLSGADYLPRVFADVFWQPAQSFRLGGEATPELYAQFRKGFEAAKSTVFQLHTRGVKLHAGTDSGNPFVVPGISLQRELALLVQAGLSAEAALAAATVIPGEFLDGQQLGRLQPGSAADMLVFSEDPTVSLDALASLTHVIADGRVYERAELEREVERYRDHFHNFAWEKAVPLLAGFFE